MEQDGLVKLVTVQVPLLNGDTVEKILILHPSLSAEDKLVKDYVDGMHDRSLIGKTCQNSSGARAQSNQNIGDIERLDDIRRRQNPDAEPSSNIEEVEAEDGDAAVDLDAMNATMMMMMMNESGKPLDVNGSAWSN